jgi:hypothetical protein
MKKPRDILFQRHETAEPGLDSLRKNVLARNFPINDEKPPVRPLMMKLWLELVWPCRRTWFGLAVVWITMALLNFAETDGRRATGTTPLRRTSSERTALEEQKRFMSELINGETAANEPVSVPQPRSEIHPALDWAVAAGILPQGSFISNRLALPRAGCCHPASLPHALCAATQTRPGNTV